MQSTSQRSIQCNIQMTLGLKNVLIIGFLVYFFVLVLNDGFMALDEYWVGITRYIPAQNSSIMKLVATDDVKSPLQLLPMHAVAQLSLLMGVHSPYWQYRIVIFILGCISVYLIFLSFLKYAKLNKLKESETCFLLLMLIFYFGAPFSLTRPMFESIAAPWLTLAAVSALKYDFEEKLSDLLWGVCFVSISFVLRQQLGFCALVFIILPLIKKRWNHFCSAGSIGFIFFILAGIPDYFIRGAFHYSLLNLTVYNYEHGADYGNRTVLFYPILIFIATFAPLFIKHYPTQFFIKLIKRYRSLLIMVGLFIFLHSLFPQKWERFIISIIPILILLMFPILYYLHQNWKENRIRLSLLYSLNGLIFVVASFFPSQKNLIEMSLYINEHPEIKKIYRVADTPGWITEAFILNKQFQFIEADQINLEALDWNDCSQVLVVGEAQANQFNFLTNRLKLNAQFNVNLIEQLAFKFNPKNNLRRVQLSLYSGCEI